MMFKNMSIGFWFQVFPVLVLGFATIILLVIKIIPLTYLFLTFVMWILVSGLGIAVGYHRVFSHRTHLLPIWKENIILFFAAFAAQGNSVYWAAIHRSSHHKYSDTVLDLHSPTNGLWHSFLGWQLKITKIHSPINLQYVRDLLLKSNHVWFLRHQLKLFWLVPLGVAFIDWKLSLMMFALPGFISILQDNGTNVIGHKKLFFGTRNFETNDYSYNHSLLALITWGQLHHNNHHHRPGSYHFGKTISGKWHEIDPCIIFLPFLGPSRQ